MTPARFVDPALLEELAVAADDTAEGAPSTSKSDAGSANGSSAPTTKRLPGWVHECSAVLDYIMRQHCARFFIDAQQSPEVSVPK